LLKTALFTIFFAKTALLTKKMAKNGVIHEKI